jgi:hypothetical protein
MLLGMSIKIELLRFIVIFGVGTAVLPEFLDGEYSAGKSNENCENG